MMIQAYHEGGHFGPLYRTQYRGMSENYYDRNEPYNHHGHHHRRSNRSEYPGRHSSRALIHETEIGGPHGQTTRKRIGMACTRCRKRKIKCSGDIDGSGCQACKAQGSDAVTCTFNRVGTLPQYDEYLTNTQPSTSQDVTLDMDPLTSTMNGPVTYHSLNHCQSLPTLHTRSTASDGYDSYTASTIDGYGNSSYGLPRTDSPYGNYDGGFRTWSNASLLPPASVTAAYDRSPAYSSGSMSTSSFPAIPQQQQQQNGRLPSATSESFSALNMGHLHTSLPTQTVQNRRLPIPQMTPSYEQPPFSGPDIPEIRPLAEPKTRLSSVHSRLGAPWSGDAGYSDCRNGSLFTSVPQIGAALQPIHTNSMPQAPTVSYHYNNMSETPAQPTAQSPSTSPTGGTPASASGSYNTAPSYPMTPMSYGSYYGLPPITTAHRSDTYSSRSMNVPSTTAYTYSPETATAASSDRTSSDASSNNMPSTYASYPTICHPQPQHTSGTEALRRQESFGPQQPQRTMAPTQRISVSNLSGEGPAYSAA